MSEPIEAHMADATIEEPIEAVIAPARIESAATTALRIQMNQLIQLAAQIRDSAAIWDGMTGDDWDGACAQFAKLQALTRMPARPVDNAAAAPVTSSPDAEETASHYVNHHVRIRGGALATVSDILLGETQTLSFQHIWTPISTNQAISLPFKQQIADRTPLFLLAAGYSNGGKTHSLLSLNPDDPPALEVLLLEALEIHHVLEIRVTTMLGKSKLQGPTHRIATPISIAPFIRSLQNPDITVVKDNGLNRGSSRRHILVDVTTIARVPVFSLIDLCGDETTAIRSGPLQEESRIISLDLLSLRRLVINLPGLMVARECALTTQFAARVPLFTKVHVLFFCDAGGDLESIRRMCWDWSKRV